MADYTQQFCPICARITLHRYPDADTPNDTVVCTAHDTDTQLAEQD